MLQNSDDKWLIWFEPVDRLRSWPRSLSRRPNDPRLGGPGRPGWRPPCGRLDEPEREELVRLRREDKQLKLEREILSKAAAWFARETDAIRPKGSSS